MIDFGSIALSLIEVGLFFWNLLLIFKALIQIVSLATLRFEQRRLANGARSQVLLAS